MQKAYLGSDDVNIIEHAVSRVKRKQSKHPENSV